MAKKQTRARVIVPQYRVDRERSVRNAGGRGAALGALLGGAAAFDYVSATGPSSKNRLSWAWRGSKNAARAKVLGTIGGGALLAGLAGRAIGRWAGGRSADRYQRRLDVINQSYRDAGQRVAASMERARAGGAAAG